MRPLLFFLFSAVCFTSFAQQNGFPFGRITRDDFAIKNKLDTAAGAVVLNEFGETYISDEDFQIHFHYHVLIMVLSKSGLDAGDFQIALRRKDEKTREEIVKLKASAYNLDPNGLLTETELRSANIFEERVNKRWDLKKGALPNVKVGSIIELQYELTSPFIYNFRSWEFQGAYPKLHSEYWATIPANYNYNVTMRGFLKLTKTDAHAVEHCFRPAGGDRSDCSRFKYIMKNVPAFIEEPYMTAPSNFISAINFELSHIQYFSGEVEKFTKEWKDAENDLRKDPNFGGQLKKGKSVFSDELDRILQGKTDELSRAKAIYYYIKDAYSWNEVYGAYSDLGLKKAFEGKKGNIADINLSLISALEAAGINVEPVILSTRANGSPVELHPVLSDYNYVVAKVTIGAEYYLLDATDDFSPFGVLPERCLNGNGRALGEKGSYFVKLNERAPAARSTYVYEMQLGEDGQISGSLRRTSEGYKAIEVRKAITSKSTKENYIESLKNNIRSMDITTHEVENFDVLESPLVEKIIFKTEAENADPVMLFNPFILNRWSENPFKLASRMYPVDFGSRLEENVTVKIKIPSTILVEDLPLPVKVALPNNGGRLLYEVNRLGDQLVVNYQLSLSKNVYGASEYASLKELFNQLVDLQNRPLVFKRKTQP